MPKASQKHARPILLMPSFERHEVSTLKDLIKARLRRAIRHSKAGRINDAKRDIIAVQKMAKLHPMEKFKSV